MACAVECMKRYERATKRRKVIHNESKEQQQQSKERDKTEIGLAVSHYVTAMTPSRASSAANG